LMGDLTISTAPGSPGQSLLTHNAEIAEEGWVNATFGYSIPISVSFIDGNGTAWSAPFANYEIHANVLGNAALTTLSFTNGFSTTIGGSFTVTVFSASGTSCGTASLGAFATPSGDSYHATSNISLNAGCAASSAIATLINPVYSVTLPSMEI
ncbi:MAG: hypothetical protein ACREB9_08905, partial [Thermoplasmata archaeon]